MIRFRSLLVSFFTAATLLLAGGSAPVAQAQQATQAEIREMFERRDQQIKSILSGRSDYTQAQRDSLKTLINGVLDFNSMAATALGPHWDTLSTDRRETFIEVFRDIVRAQSISDLDVYNSKVTYDQITIQDDSAFVRTMTDYEGTRTPVEYILKRTDGTWKAEDIVVDGVSTAEGYARSFQTVVRKRSFEALMRSLRKKRAEVTGSSSS
jgi:phospholipid transport system substrate-binding protein